ncbi:hypothetical protein O23A_p4023 [Aeromonas salmonicida]|nr:hypothetical protein O23A_p4023 [Aeromonas salmonicida]
MVSRISRYRRWDSRQRSRRVIMCTPSVGRLPPGKPSVG